MTPTLNDETADPLPLGAIHADPIEQYAVFVHQSDADKFAAEKPDWRVDWCVEIQPALIVQVV
jgi:hypothetical protein